VATANGFLQFLSGYSIFQGPVVGIMITDYFLVRRGNLHLPDLFTASPAGRYFYAHGFNLRAFAAFVIGFLLPFPGFVASFGHSIGLAATHMFTLGWVLSFVVGSVAYWVICMVFKVPGDDAQHGFEEQVAVAEEMTLSRESDGSSATEKAEENIEKNSKGDGETTAQMV
jgi:NCS1 family nucleobase:cation symporter-1